MVELPEEALSIDSQYQLIQSTVENSTISE